MCSFSPHYYLLFHDKGIVCAKANFKDISEGFDVDCIVESFENPVQLEEMDLRLEKKWWSKVKETDEWYKLQYEGQDYVWTLKTLT